MRDGGAFRNARVYLTGQNLFTISGYTGSDPEVRIVDAESGDLLAPGIDRRNNYFLARTITLGVTLGF